MPRASAVKLHRWSFFRAGGVDQVKLEKGEDVFGLDQLDQKLWVALSCPTRGLEFDQRTLELLDTDKDGVIRPPEIVGAVKWLRDVLRSGDPLVHGEDGVDLGNLRDDTAEGKALLSSAKLVLRSLGKEDATKVTIADATRTNEVFAAARWNGDGIVPPESMADADVRAAAVDVVACTGGELDRSGRLGVSQAAVDRFFAECAAYDAWSREAERDAATLLPFGDETDAAADAVDAVRTKVDDWFARARVVAFDPRAAAAVNFDPKAWEAVASAGTLLAADTIERFPVAVVEAGKPLPLNGSLNPAWRSRMARFGELCFDGKRDLGEDEWARLVAKLEPHREWKKRKAGATVEKLGLARIRELLAGNAREQLSRAVADDLAVAAEIEAMGKLEKLARLHAHFHELLVNYVSFKDFYSRAGAIFQAGTLYLDGRSCDLCFHVHDATKHAAMAAMAKTYLVYVDCVRPGEKTTVACAFTAGDSDNLFVGRNGVFYDRKGRDWTATITRIVDNPISIGQAFWSPYKKVLRWIEEHVARRAAAANDGVATKLLGATSAAGTAAAKPGMKIDVGVVAALGVGVGALTAAISSFLATFLGLGPWIPFGVLALVLAISLPAVVIAWLKLRQRNLGPILDANGWAVNTLTRVNLPLGRSLTDLAKLPAGAQRSLRDPYAPKKRAWPWVLGFLLLLGAAGYALYRENVLHRWFPEVDWLRHHVELGLVADKARGKPGEIVTFTVGSGATELLVVDETDADRPAVVQKLAVDANTKTTTLTLTESLVGKKIRVSDEVANSDVYLTVEKKE